MHPGTRSSCRRRVCHCCWCYIWLLIIFLNCPSLFSFLLCAVAAAADVVVAVVFRCFCFCCCCCCCDCCYYALREVARWFCAWNQPFQIHERFGVGTSNQNLKSKFGILDFGSWILKFGKSAKVWTLHKRDHKPRRVGFAIFQDNTLCCVAEWCWLQRVNCFPS